MKLTRHIKRTVLALALANGFFAAAQSNTMPGPADYDRFSAFITARNIFDPNRYAITTTARPRYARQTPRYAPMFTLVGTMSYAKGMFAFFDGNQSELRKVLYQSDGNGIASYTVTDITPAGVTLQSADKKETLQMKIGDAMRQEGGSWQPAGQVSSTDAGGSTAPAEAGSTGPDTSAAPSPALEGNDVLKKLMQQREQELK